MIQHAIQHPKPIPLPKPANGKSYSYEEVEALLREVRDRADADARSRLVRRPQRVAYYFVAFARRDDGVLELINGVEEVPETHTNQRQLCDGIVKLCPGLTEEPPEDECGPSPEELIGAIKRASVPMTGGAS